MPPNQTTAVFHSTIMYRPITHIIFPKSGNSYSNRIVHHDSKDLTMINFNQPTYIGLFQKINECVRLLYLRTQSDLNSMTVSQ